MGDVANSLALRIFLPLAAAAVAALALNNRYTDVVAIAAICAMGPLSEQVTTHSKRFSRAVSDQAVDVLLLLTTNSKKFYHCAQLSQQEMQSFRRVCPAH